MPKVPTAALRTAPRPLAQFSAVHVAHGRMLTMLCARSQPVVVDARGHMLGRLASVMAKQLLTGQYLVRPRANRDQCVRVC